ncbi:hypothetical protein OHA42_26690 [Nocardia sp. NBC_01009]|nr:hypothetical protein OHA42_26690 [Nocardia sp. NBC_01009]
MHDQAGFDHPGVVVVAAGDAGVAGQGIAEVFSDNVPPVHDHDPGIGDRGDDFPGRFTEEADVVDRRVHDHDPPSALACQREQYFGERALSTTRSDTNFLALQTRLIELGRHEAADIAPYSWEAPPSA